MDEKEDNNKEVFFVELEGATLQVGRPKKKKDMRAVLAQAVNQVEPRRQITCSICKKQGHNKGSCSRV